MNIKTQDKNLHYDITIETQKFKDKMRQAGRTFEKFINKEKNNNQSSQGGKNETN